MITVPWKHKCHQVHISTLSHDPHPTYIFFYTKNKNKKIPPKYFTQLAVNNNLCCQICSIPKTGSHDSITAPFSPAPTVFLLLLHSPAIFLGFTILGEIFAYATFFKSNHWGSHIPSLWMVHAGCVFIAGLHPSRIWMPGSFEPMRWSACEHRLDLSFHSHLKEFCGYAREMEIA